MLNWYSCNSVELLHGADVTAAQGGAQCNSDVISVYFSITTGAKSEFFRALSENLRMSDPARPITTLLRSLYLQNYASDLHAVFQSGRSIQ